MPEPLNFREFITELTDIEDKYAPDKLYFEGDTSLLIENRRVSVVESNRY